MRKIAVIAAALVLAALVLIAFPQAQNRPTPASPTVPESIAFRIVFGYERTAPKSYNGRVSTTAGALEKIETWRFQSDDSITAADSWKLQVRRITYENQPDQPQSLAGGPPTQNLVPEGVIITVSASTVS